KNINISLRVHNQGQFLFNLESQQANLAFTSLPPKGRVYCYISRFPLMPGRYGVNTRLSVNDHLQDSLKSAKIIDVGTGDFFGTGYVRSIPTRRRHVIRPGVYVQHSWYTEPEVETLDTQNLKTS
ncbi:MAG: hypothetical protein ACFFBD_15330, partial [Candidatus Hodarchaeota archaeon]